MTSPADLREWISLLEREGELVRVAAEVDPRLEVTEIVDRTVKSGGPALLFERPKGSSHPLLVNQFGSERRICLAFGVDRLDDAGAKLADVLEMQPPAGLVDKLRGLRQLKSIADSLPNTVRKGACQEIVLRGDEVDLGRLPVQTCWPLDAAPFITLPAVITRDPATGQRNVGMYRMQILGPRSTAMHWQLHKDGRADFAAAGGRMEVAVALGLDPVTAYSASAPLPKHIDELMFAGFMRGAAVDVVKGVTVDLEVPAAAEIVLEGYVEPGDLVPEGPFGDHTGYYTPVEPFPVFHVTALTMRRDAIYPSIVVGKPPQEDAWLGKATERIFLPAIRASVPEIVDYDLPVAGGADVGRGVAQLRHRAGLDLTDALTGEAEVLGHFLERALATTVEPEPQAEDGALALVEHLEDLGDLAGQQRHRRRVERGRGVAVLDEVAELGVAVVADGLVERDRVDGVTEHLDDLVERQLGLAGQLGQRRRAAERALELGAHLEQRGEHVAGVHGQTDDASRVGDAALDRLADPPGGVRRELEALAPVELVDRVDEAEVALLHDVEQRADPTTGTSWRSRRRAAGSSSRTGGAPLRPDGSRAEGCGAGWG